jgi:hypothetical protein
MGTPSRNTGWKLPGGRCAGGCNGKQLGSSQTQSWAAASGMDCISTATAMAERDNRDIGPPECEDLRLRSLFNPEQVRKADHARAAPTAARAGHAELQAHRHAPHGLHSQMACGSVLQSRGGEQAGAAGGLKDAIERATDCVRIDRAELKSATSVEV